MKGKSGLNIKIISEATRIVAMVRVLETQDALDFEQGEGE